MKNPEAEACRHQNNSTLKPEQTSRFVVLDLHLVVTTVSYKCSSTVCAFALLLCVNASKENTKMQAVFMSFCECIAAPVRSRYLCSHM